MNNFNTPIPRDPDTLQARFALRVTGRLNEAAEQLPHDLGERLRVAREQALLRAQQARQGARRVSGASSRAGLASPWWLKLASFAPLVLLILGLSLIEEVHDRTQIAAAAEIDVALLADQLPPDAYRDAGFMEFLKTAQE